MTKGEKTQSKIIDAAIDIFQKVGFQWASFQMLAEKVGISQPAIYGYFRDKDDLLKACCLTVAQRGQTFIDKGIDPLSPALLRFQNYVKGNLLWVLQKPMEANVLLAMYCYSAINKDLKKLHREIDAAGMRRIQIHLAQVFLEKGLSFDENGGLERTVHNLLVGEMIKTLHWPDEISDKKRLQSMMLAITRLINTYQKN